MSKESKISFRKIDRVLNKVPISYNLIIVIINVLLYFNLFGITPHPCDEILTEADKFQSAFYTISDTLYTIILGLICYRLKFCAYNWFSVASLFIINIINLIGVFFEMPYIVYEFAFMNFLILVLTSLSVLLYIVEIRKPKNKDT